MSFPEHEFECPLCGLPLNEEGWHKDGTQAWERYECEFNTTHWDEKPVRVRPTKAMMNEAEFKELMKQEEAIDIEFERLLGERKDVKAKIKERLSKG